jgi:alpha-L-fucosidase
MDSSTNIIKQASNKGLTWFQDARFGMFIHWGLYALLGRGEWVMHWERIPVSEYERLAGQFNPAEFDADEWVALAMQSGQKYMVITSRHHDGFSMYDTALSDYKVTNTPFHRDPLAELAEACVRSGQVKLGFYVSLLDWHHPAYRFRQESGLAWEDYLAFLHGQVRELCTQYGEVACFWFDGDWPRQKLTDENAYFAAGGSFEYERLYNLAHELQPDAVIQNNRHARPLPGEDIQGFEQDLPGSNAAGFNTTEVYDLPVEVCMTMNDHWGIYVGDENYKSTRALIHNLARAASVGGNYLLNVGPSAEGLILPVQAQRLREMGAWLDKNGEAIYATRAGVIPPTSEAVSTSRGDTHYLHVLEYPSDCVVLEGLPPALSSTRLPRAHQPVEMKIEGGHAALTLPADMRDPFDTVVVLN